MQEYRDFEKLVNREIKIIQVQFSSVNFNLRSETRAVWLMKGRARKDQSTKQYTKTLNRFSTVGRCTGNITHNTAD